MTSYPTIQIDTNNRRQRSDFHSLPRRIYRGIPQYVPPLTLGQADPLDTRRNPFFQHSTAAFFVTYTSDHQPAGRIAVLNNRNYNRYHNARTGFFTFFECIDEPAAACSLIEAACDWGRSQGLDEISGPKGFTALDGMGLLARGFEHRPAFGIAYNPPYYPALLEQTGFEMTGEVVSGYLPGSVQLPERIHRASELIQRRRGLRVATYRTRAELRSLIPGLQALYNGALEGTTGNTPLTDAEAKSLGDQLLWFADPRLIKIVLKGDDPVGFLFAYPDISPALQRCGGRLLPFGWLDILRELRQAEWVNINGAGMLPDYRGLGGTALLFSEMEKSIRAGGFKHADLVQIGVENDKMQRELRDFGVDFYKAHRTYRKAL